MGAVIRLSCDHEENDGYCAAAFIAAPRHVDWEPPYTAEHNPLAAARRAAEPQGWTSTFVMLDGGRSAAVDYCPRHSHRQRPRLDLEGF